MYAGSKVASSPRRGNSPPPRPVRVLLVSPEPLLASAIAHTLDTSGSAIICGTSRTTHDAVERASASSPDVIVATVERPTPADLSGIGYLSRRCPAIPILVLGSLDGAGAVEVMVAGAAGYVVRSREPESLEAAVVATAEGHSVLGWEVGAAVVARLRARDTPLTASATDGGGDAIRALLSARELEILVHLSTGANNREIGEALNLSGNTVANHVASILFKLQVDRRVQAAVLAVRCGIC